MNTKITDIGEQLGIVDLEGKFYSPNYEMFAELIVRECAQFIEDKFDFCGDELLIAEKLREHFGVEE